MLAIDAKAVGVAEYAHTWIEQRNLKPRTRSGDHDLLRLHIDPMLGKVPLKNLTRETVRGWVFDAGHRSLTARQSRLRSASCHLCHGRQRRPDRLQSQHDHRGDEPSAPA
jgi:hypothetical protein